MPRLPHSALLLLSLAVVSACRSETRTADTASAMAGDAMMSAGDSAKGAMGMSGKMGEKGEMKGGMSGGMGMHDTVATTVQAHLERLKTTNPDSLKALVPADRAVVTALIADCEQMMRGMKMEPPRKWHTAVADLKKDLDKMGAMSGAQLVSAMPGHRTRIEGMLAMRGDMMAK